MDFIINFIKDEKLKKNFFVAILFAVLFTCLSPHFFVKNEYWKNKHPLPFMGRIPTYFNAQQKDDEKFVFDINKIYITNAAYVLDEGEYKYNDNIKLTVPSVPFTFDFDINYHNIDEILIKPGEYAHYTDFKINNVQYLDKLKSDFKVKVPGGVNGTLHFSVSTKPVTKPVNLFKQISYPALIITFAFWFFLSLYFTDKLTSLNRKNIIPKLKNFFVKYKYEIILLTVFALFYFIENIKSIRHVNQFNWCITSGDAPVTLLNIFYNETKRFHPYIFMALYPLFDISILISQNILLSVGIVYLSITSLSVMFLYKAIKHTTNQNLISLIAASIYGVSRCPVHLSQSFDQYVITGFYLTLLLYLISKELKSKEYNVNNMVMITITTALTLGVTIPNVITALLLILPVFIIKKNPKFILKLVLLFCLSTAFFTQMKGFTCDNQSWSSLFYSETKQQTKVWFKSDIKENYKIFKKETLKNPISMGEKGKAPALFLLSVLSIFTVLSLFLMKGVYKKEEVLAYFSYILALLYNLVADFFWCPGMGFLFSINFYAIYFILLASSINVITRRFPNKRLYCAICIPLLVYVFILAHFNHKENKAFQNWAQKTSPVTYNFLKGK